MEKYITFGRNNTPNPIVSESLRTEAHVKKCQFNSDLYLGSTGLEVLALQKFLNDSPDTRIAESGIGSRGQETDYFGALTFNAVFAYQAKYAQEILAPLGLTNPTGYWGEATRKYAHTQIGC